MILEIEVIFKYYKGVTEKSTFKIMIKKIKIIFGTDYQETKLKMLLLAHI